ncbi:MAG: hypothetical protein ABII79_13170 [bacterium]
MRKQNIYSVVFALTLVLVVLAAREQVLGKDYQREALRGIQSVKVFITTSGEDHTLESQIKTGVELKLRLAGIDVVPEEDTVRRTQSFLDVLITWTKLDDDHHLIFSVDLELMTFAHLPHDTSCALHNVIIWNNSYFAITPSKRKFRQDARLQAKDLTDQFINDYLAANPKKKDNEP